MKVPHGGVWLDARAVQSVGNPERGIARYVAEHAQALTEVAPELIGSIGLDPALPVPPSIQSMGGSGLFGWHTRRSPAKGPPPIYHVTSPFEPIDMDDIWPDWARRGGSRLVITLHDLIPLVLRERYLGDPARGDWNVFWIARLGLIRSAQQVLTNSRQTADDAIEHLGIPEERITVIDSGVSETLSALVGSRAEAESVLRGMRRLRPGFLLYVGGDDPRKNLEGTIRAYSLLPEALRSSHQLVIVCRIPFLRRRELARYARGLGIPSRDLLLTGFVPDRELAALYRTCELFVFPSLYEGAGLPVLEAMSCGAPVAASGTSSVPEILGDTEATFDPSRPEDIARCLEEVLGNPSRRESLLRRSRERVRLYTWERVARRTLEGYERAMDAPVTRQRRRRKRLVVVSPWPAQPAEAAGHSRRLVEALNAHAEVDVVVAADGEPELDRSLEPQARLWSDVDFAWLRHLRDYDRCLYVLGNSPLHVPAFEAMMRAPGTVLLLDPRLDALYSGLHRERFPEDPYWLERKLVQMYGDRVPERILKRIPYGGLYAEYGVLMTREVQAAAKLVLVRSPSEAEALGSERPANAAPVEQVPDAIEGSLARLAERYAEVLDL
jgi:glycosyltransferase involved in cell wall biosynthesis